MESELQVQNRLGLHARTASDFARCAARFESRLLIEVGERRFSARRAIDVLEANLDCGARFKLVAEGPDAEVATAALERYLRHLAEIDRQDEVRTRTHRLRRSEPLLD